MTAESTEVKTAAPIDLKDMAEEFVMALQWDLRTGRPFTGQPVDLGKMRMFSLDMPHGASFLPIARQMAEEIKAETCGREKCVVLPALRPGITIPILMPVEANYEPVMVQVTPTAHYETILGSYSVIDRETWRSARLLAFEDFIRFEVCLESKEVITL